MIALGVDDERLQHAFQLASHFGLHGLELTGFDERSNVVVRMETLPGFLQALADARRDRQIGTIAISDWTPRHVRLSHAIDGGC